MKRFTGALQGKGSFKQQIILVFVLGFFLLVAAFIAYMARIESNNLYQESDRAASGLAQSLSVSSRSWVLANDVAGMQEIIHSFRAYPELRYAMLLSRTGRVLAHSDPEKVGLFLTDATSQRLIQLPAGRQLLVNNAAMIDIAVPIQIDQRHVGWARVALGRDQIVADIRDMVRQSVIFVLLASTLAFLAALVIANRLGARIGTLVRVAEGVRAGNFDERAVVAERRDEVTRLADSFNRMLDTLAENEKALRAASQKVAELSQRNRMILDSAGEGIYGLDSEGVCTFANPATAQMLGFSVEELVGRDSHALFHHTRPDGQPYPQHECPVQQARKDGMTHRGTDLYWRKDGSRFEVEFVSTPIIEAGEPTGAVVVFHDLSELKRTEMALRESEQFLNSVVDHVPAMLFIKEAENLGFVRLNKSGEALLGYSQADLAGKNDYDFFPKEEADQFVGKDRAIIKSGQLLDIPEEQITTRHLGLRYLHTKKIPIHSDDGKPLYLLGISEDITERKLADEQLHRSRKSLAEAQRIARLGNWELDLTTNVLDWSDEIYRIFEIDPEKFSPSYEAFLDAIHPDDRERVNQAYTESVRSRVPYDIEHRLLMKDGRIKFVNEKCETYYDGDGKPLRSIGTVHDITELKLKEEELRRYKDHLEEEVQQRTADLVLARNAAEAANKAKSVFLANMSHELRTPLNAILGFSNLMRKDPELEMKQRQNLDIINRSGEHLLTLINDVLDMAKIESGRVQLEEVPFDLGSLVRDVTDMMQIRAQEKGLRLLIDQTSRFPRYIVGDEARLRQVLINLLGNAVKFTAEGGVTVRLGTKHNNLAHLLIEVEDSGPGIAPEDQARVFEPFVQLGEQGVNKGTGLGLTITRQFVQLMGGSLGLESTLGKGSIFRVELPLKQAAESDIVKPDTAQKGEVSGLAPGQSEYRILIVEDQRDNQLLLARLLESAGFKFKVAENGQQSVQMFQEWRPHFIWMDRRMPVMDGLEATRQIRKLPGGKEVKIVAVTASAFQEQRAELIEAGMDDFVRKPYRSNEIYETLQKHLGVRYVYEGMPEPEGEALGLTSEQLAKLPQALLDEIRDALESLESTRIASALQKVAPYDEALQKSLSGLVENFDYPAILKALQTCQHA